MSAAVTEVSLARCISALAAAMLCINTGAVAAQPVTWKPDKPVELIVGTAPGAADLGAAR